MPGKSATSPSQRPANQARLGRTSPSSPRHLRTPSAGQQIWPTRKAARETPGGVEGDKLHQIHVHAQLTALAEGHVGTPFVVRPTTKVRFARRIAMQVRRQQARELSL